tara:strand:+ start:66 stop:1685 length:1620 start_codon:yes stop_codon:yes gene_type:complete
MSEILIHFFIFSSILFGNGYFFYFIQKRFIKLNFFEIIFFGIIISGFFAYSINFFLPLNDILLIINLLLSFLFIFFFFYKKEDFAINKKYNLFYLLFFSLVVLNIYSSGYSDDLNHYHGGFITNADNTKIIFGYNLLHHHYGYNSIWLYLHSFLNFNDTFLQDIHVLNGICLFLVLNYFFYEFYFRKENSIIIKSLFFSLLIFFLIKYTRLKEFGIDRPGILLSSFFLMFYLKKNQEILGFNEKKKLIDCSLLAAFFLTSIKIFFIFSFSIPLLLIIRTYLDHKQIYFNSVLVSILGLIYIFKNILTSGCIIYPISITCINLVEWNSYEVVKNLFLSTEASTKSFDMYKGLLSVNEYVENFNWLNTWLSRNLEELLNYFLTIIFCFIVSMLCFPANLKFQKFSNFNFLAILIFLVLNTILFIKTPVIRYHHVLFLSLLMLLRYIFQANIKFKKKTILGFFILCFVFNFGKNIIRISNENFINNPIAHIKKVNWYRKPVQNKINNFIYYKGWIDAYPVGNMDLSNKKHKKFLNFYDVIYH